MSKYFKLFLFFLCLSFVRLRFEEEEYVLFLISFQTSYNVGDEEPD